MNYVKYIKKQGFKKCVPFSLTEDRYYLKNSSYPTFDIKTCYVEKGELVFEENARDVIIIKGFELNFIDPTTKKNEVKKFDKWNHFKYNQYYIDEDLYILIHNKKGKYEIMLTDSIFSFIRLKHFPLENLKNGLFDSDLQKTIGNIRFREYIINKLLKN